MDEGILWLRLLVAAVLFAHAGQKSLGWFGGRGIGAMSGAFEGFGLRPGRVFVILAAVFESLAAVSLAVGLLAPLGAAVAASTMTVAGFALQRTSGTFWNVTGGGEYPYFIALVGLGLGFTGAGMYSLDRLIGSAVPAYAVVTAGGLSSGLAAIVICAVGAMPFVLRMASSRDAAPGE